MGVGGGEEEEGGRGWREGGRRRKWEGRHSNCLFFKAQESIQTNADLSTINYTDHCQSQYRYWGDIDYFNLILRGKEAITLTK